MKRLIIGLFAMAFFSSVALAGPGDKGKKAKKAKTHCTKNCQNKKNQKKSTMFPNKPGCVCN